MTKVTFEVTDAYSVQEACTKLGISRPTIYRWIKSGKLRVLRVGGKSIVAREEIDRLKAQPISVRGRIK